MDGRDLERVIGLEVGQDPDESFGEHRLAGSGWAHQQQVVPARGRHLERQPRERLTPDLAQVERRRFAHRLLDDGRIGPRLVAGQHRDQVAEVCDRTHDEPPDERGFDRVRRRHHDLAGLERRRHGQRTGDVTHGSVEAELAEERGVLQSLRDVLGQLLGCHEHSDRDGEVEARPELAHAARRQVHRDALVRPLGGRST